VTVAAADPEKPSARITLSGVFDDTPWSNQFWFKMASSGDVSTEAADAFMDSVEGYWQEATHTYRSPNHIIERAELVVWQDLIGPVEFDRAYDDVGTASGSALPASICAVISWKSGLYYRGGKPHTMLNGLTTALAEDNRSITAGVALGLASACNNFITNCNTAELIVGSGVTLGYMSRQTPLGPLSPWHFYAFESAATTVRQKFGSLRRRLNIPSS